MIWNWKNGICIKNLTDLNQKSRINCIKVFPGNRLTSGCEDGEIKFWDIKTGTCLNTMKAHEKNVWNLKLTSII